jgi:hypothetical protein
MSYSQYLKVLDLYDAAEVAFGNGQHAYSAELYRQALDIAESSASVPVWLRAVLRRSYADELVSLERLREALAALAPLSQPDAQADCRSCCVFGNLTDHIEIAQELPVSLKTIERAHAQAEDYYPVAGERTWQSRILHYKGELFLLRGQLAEALSTAQEGWAVWEKDCPRLHATTHLYGLFRISLAVRDEFLAHSYLRKWVEYDEEENKNYKIREVLRCQMESELARLAGEINAALDWARRAAQGVELIDWGAIRYGVGNAAVRAFLLAGEHGRAGDMLARLAQMRRSESAHDRYGFQLLRADFHLARARRAAGIAQSDDELGVEFPTPAEIENPPVTLFELGKARAAYDAALKIGCWIDDQLECHARRQEIYARRARLESIEKAAALLTR